MSEDAQPVDLQSLGVNNYGIGAEAILDTDSNVTIQNTDGDTVTLNRGQVQNLVTFLVSQMELEATRR